MARKYFFRSQNNTKKNPVPKREFTFKKIALINMSAKHRINGSLVLHQEIPSDMAEVLSSGKPKTILGNDDLIAVLTPVYNSLGEIVGLVEVAGRVRMNWQENVK